MTIVMKKSDKLKHLLRIWPMHTIATSTWFMKQGLSYGNLNKYVKSNWVKNSCSSTDSSILCSISRVTLLR